MAEHIFNTDNNQEESPTFETLIDEENQRLIDNNTAINANYNQYIQAINKAENPYDAIAKTVQKRKVIDPRVASARRNLGSLYDAFQTLGSLAAMAGTTASPVKLSSAAAAQNNFVNEMTARQREADEQYNDKMANLKLKSIDHNNATAAATAAARREQQETLRAAKNESLKTIQDLYREAIKAENARRIAEANNKSRERQATIRASAAKNNNNTPYIIPYGDKEYTIPKNKWDEFIARLASAAGYDIDGIDGLNKRTLELLPHFLLYNIDNYDKNKISNIFADYDDDLTGNT